MTQAMKGDRREAETSNECPVGLIKAGRRDGVDVTGRTLARSHSFQQRTGEGDLSNTFPGLGRAIDDTTVREPYALVADVDDPFIEVNVAPAEADAFPPAKAAEKRQRERDAVRMI